MPVSSAIAGSQQGRRKGELRLSVTQQARLPGMVSAGPDAGTSSKGAAEAAEVGMPGHLSRKSRKVTADRGFQR